MRRIYVYLLSLTLIVICRAGLAFGADDARIEIPLDGAARERMSAFVSNFTAAGMYETANRNYMKYGDFVYFGVTYNYINNPKIVKKTKDGRLSVDVAAVRRAVEKYFGVDAVGAGGNLISAFYEGKNFERTKAAFLFEKPAPWTIYHARVDEAYDEDGVILMKGELYERDAPKNTGGSFYAWAEPYIYGGENTWSLVSIHRGKHDGAPFGAEMTPPRGGLTEVLP
jgi:hypothetical protein